MVTVPETANEKAVLPGSLVVKLTVPENRPARCRHPDLNVVTPMRRHARRRGNHRESAGDRGLAHEAQAPALVMVNVHRRRPLNPRQNPCRLERSAWRRHRQSPGHPL